MRSILKFIYPKRCLACDSTKQLLGELAICNACYEDLPHNRTSCSICSLPLEPHSLLLNGPVSGESKEVKKAQQGICAHCLKQRPVFQSSWSPFIYGQPLEWMIGQLKFNDKQMFAPLLSELMCLNVPSRVTTAPMPDVIVPMPLHPARLKQRGFNQSTLLAKPLSEYLGITLDTSACRRIKNTEHQTGKTAQQRRQNIRGAFEVQQGLNYKHVVVLDDVVTTASSVSELTITLLRQGVERVDVWSLSRAEK